MSEVSQRFRELATGSRREREAAFEAGEAPSADAIADHEYRGYNTVWFAPLVRIRKFVKAFFREDGVICGCNTPAEQNGLDEPWAAQPGEARPRRFGFYVVEPPAGHGRHPEAALLDYSRGRNHFFQPARFLRDYLVRVEPGSDELLLGKAYVALGPLRVPVSYFVLERRRALPDQPRLPER